MEELQSYAARTAGTIFELAVRLLGGKVEPMVFKEAGSRRRSHTCSLNFLGTRRDGNFMCRWTFFDTMGRIPKIFSRCARRRNCVLRSRSCGCARVVTLRMSSRPKFPRSQSRRFCRWRRCGNGSLIWKSPGTIRSVRRLYPRGGGNGVFGARLNPFRGLGHSGSFGRSRGQVSCNPLPEISEGAAAQRTLAGKRLRCGAPQFAVAIKRRLLL